MNDKKIRFVAFSGVAFFLIAIIYFFVSLSISIQKAHNISQEIFENFIADAQLKTINTEEQSSSVFNSVIDAINNNPSIGATVLYVDGVPSFAFPVSSNLIHQNERNEPMVYSASPMLKTHSTSVITTKGQNIVVHAISYILQQKDIFNAARVSFIIVLAYTLFLFIFLVYITLNKSSQEEKELDVDFTNPLQDSVSDDETINDYKFSNYDLENDFTDFFKEETLEDSLNEDLTIDENSELNNERETIPVVFRETESSWDEIITQNAEEMLSEKILNLANLSDTEVLEEDIPLLTKNEDYVENTTNSSKCEEAPVSSISDPTGLFSKITGLGWAQYMEPRLDAELTRSTSAEQDLALVLLEVKNIDENQDLKKKIVHILLDFFKYRDFLFEHTKNSFAGILVNMDLDQTMLLCESVYTALKKLLKDEDINTEIGIGVSTKSLRILPGSRIITEAEEALARSFHERDLPIVAFRVNPERYRNFVASALN